MARRRNQIENMDPDAPAPMPDKRSRRRIVIPVDEDGRPDISRLDDEVLDLIRQEAEAQEPPEPIAPEVCAMLVTVIAQIESAVLAPRFGLSQEAASQAIMPPPPMRDQIAQAGSRVLTKYSGTLGQWQDEIMLASLLVAWQAAALNNLREMARLQKESAGKTEPAPEAKPPAEGYVRDPRDAFPEYPATVVESE